jgi:PPOX class probable F420-dependent enzyme
MLRVARVPREPSEAQVTGVLVTLRGTARIRRRAAPHRVRSSPLHARVACAYRARMTQFGGTNQRDLIKMTEAEVAEYLQGRRTASMCTINPDGTIHAVAMWYGFLEGALAFETKAKSQKIQNLRRHPTLTVMIEDGDYYEELRGITLVGRGEIVEDPDRMWELGVSVFERYNGPYSDDLKPFVEVMLRKRFVVKLHVDRTVTWDHTKLGLPPSRPVEVAEGPAAESP